MREFVLNDQSVQTAASKAEAARQLRSIAQGIATLVDLRFAQTVLRVCVPLSELACSPEGSFWDCLIALRTQPSSREEGAFLLSMSSKCPLHEELPQAHEDRFWGVECIPDNPLSTPATALCAITNAVLVSLPTKSAWTSDTVSVEFNELNFDGNVETIADTVDNIAQLTNSQSIAERMRRSLQGSLNQQNFWGSRGSAFPSLIFAPSVQQDIAQLNPSLFQVVFKRLKELDDASKEWKEGTAVAPRWRSKVTPESESVRNNDELLSARKFIGHDGAVHLFEIHARFGNGGRIHLRLITEAKGVEIGYVGSHLPLR